MSKGLEVTLAVDPKGRILDTPSGDFQFVSAPVDGDGYFLLESQSLEYSYRVFELVLRDLNGHKLKAINPKLSERRILRSDVVDLGETVFRMIQQDDGIVLASTTIRGRHGEVTYKINFTEKKLEAETNLQHRHQYPALSHFARRTPVGHIAESERKIQASVEFLRSLDGQREDSGKAQVACDLLSKNPLLSEAYEFLLQHYRRNRWINSWIALSGKAVDAFPWNEGFRWSHLEAYGASGMRLVALKEFESSSTGHVASFRNPNALRAMALIVAGSEADGLQVIRRSNNWAEYERLVTALTSSYRFKIARSVYELGESHRSDKERAQRPLSTILQGLEAQEQIVQHWARYLREIEAIGETQNWKVPPFTVYRARHPEGPR